MSASANGVSLTWCRVTVPWSGVPMIECEGPEEVVPKNGLIVAQVEDFTFTGTLVRSGLFAGNWSGYGVAGRNGWGKFLPPKGYQSPFGLLNSQLILDAAVEAGEPPPLVAVPAITGEFFVRRGDLPASQVFRALSPGVDWWIDPATGITQVGIRGGAVTQAQFDLISYDARQGRLLLATDAPSAFVPGVSFVDPSTGAFVVNAAVITSEEAGVRVEVWTA